MGEHMTEPDSTTQPDPAAQPDAPPAPEPDDKTDWKAEARKWEQRAKENKAARDEVEKARKASMTEAERAVAEAEARGRTAAASEYGQRIARSEFLAAAARRNADFDAASILEDVNLARYLSEDGEPDSKALAAAVERLIPAPAGVASFDQGPRASAPKGADMNSFIRQATGRR